MNHKLTALTIGALALLVASSVSYAAIVNGTASSFGVIQGEFADGVTPDAWLPTNSNTDRVGAGGSAQRINVPVLGFTLPALPAGEQITSVNFGFTMAAAAINSGANFTAVISLMNYDLIDDFSGADYSSSVSSLGNGTLVATFNDTDIANDSVESFALTGAALTLFQSFYDASGNPLQSEVWFRISHDAGAWNYATMGQDRYSFLDDNTGNVTRSLTIATSAVPEPSTFALIMAGAGALLILRRRYR